MNALARLQNIFCRTAVLSTAVTMLTALTFTAGAQEPFDHFSTGFQLDGAHSIVTCDRCHTGGTFQGANPTCISCHSTIGAVRATVRPMNHIRSSEICSDCHTTAAWSPVAYMDHAAVSGSCGTCHNGFIATGKTPTHIQSSNQCDNCHISTAWVPAVFDHTDVIGNCVGCHNGFDATGKGPTHVRTSDVCEDCHSTTFWEPAVTVDHTQVLGSCSSCHNGVIAEGKNPTHITSGDNCEDCHTTVAWIPASFDHTTIVDNCNSCHNGTDATGKDPGHFVTQQECNVCHDTAAWLPHVYRHMGLTYEPLDHRGNFDCAECHQNNTEAVTWPSAAFQPDCAGCHANDFERKGDHIGGENGTVSQNRDCGGSGCHRISDNEFD